MDELGDGGSVGTFVESSAMTVTVPNGDEPLMEAMEEGEIEDSFDGEDGEDLMIEVVGSDVFVDGVSGNGEEKEGLGTGGESFVNEGMLERDVESKEAGDLEGRFWDGTNGTGAEGIQDIPGEMGENSGQVLQKEGVEAHRVEVSVREQDEVEGLVKDQIIGGEELVHGEDEAPGKASQGTGVLDHEVWNPGIDGEGVSSLSAPEQENPGIDGEGVSSLSAPEQEPCVHKEEFPQKDKILISGSDVPGDGLPASVRDQSSDVEMAEAVPDASDKDNVHHASDHTLHNPAEPVLSKHAVLQSTEECAPAATRNIDANLDDQCVQSSGKVETLQEDHQAFDNTRNNDHSSVDIPASSELPNCFRETEIVDGPSYPGKFEDSAVEPETRLSDGKNQPICSEDFPTKQDGNTHTVPESSHVQSSVDERGEWVVMDIDEVLDFKEEAIVLDAPGSVLSSSENVEDPSGKSSIAPKYDDALKPASAVTETGVNDVNNTVDVNGGEGHAQSGVAFVKEPAGLVIENNEVAGEKDANIRGEVLEGNSAIGEIEQSNTLDVPRVTETKVAEANPLSSSEPSVDVSHVELSTESQVVVPACNAAHGGPLTDDEINDNKVDEGILSQAKDGVSDNSPAEVPVEIINASILPADSNVVLEFDFPEIKTEGDEKDITVGEQFPDDREAEMESGCHQSNGNEVMQVDVVEIKSDGDEDMSVGEQFLYEGQIEQGNEDISIGENASEMDQSKAIEEETSRTPLSVSIGQPAYLLGTGEEGEFSITDLVWGKVRSHPWWPGQIFDPEDASEKAVKYYKKDSFLVAYFGDRTFAWNDASVLKPFRQYFSQIEKQSSSEAFQNAVSCALDEVSRRVKLGLSCSCISRDAREMIEYQVVENTGIREESSRRYGVDKSTEARSFEPDKLLQYVRLLAQSPLCSADRLELVLAQAQLSAFCCFKGYRELATLESRDEVLQKDVETSKMSDAGDQLISNDDEQLASPHKVMENQKDSLHPRKERSLSELMGDMDYFPEDEDDSDGKALNKLVPVLSGKKRKAVDSLADGSDRRTSFYAAKVSTTSSSPKPSFKVGDCIRRVASQLTGSSPVLKGINEQTGIDAGEDSQQCISPREISSLEELLSRLQLVARDPKKGYSFLSNIIVFFSGFRNSVVRKHTPAGKPGGSRKRKAEQPAIGATEEFEFDDVNDSYWTDRIVQNYSEEQLLQISENGDRDDQLVAADANKVRKPGRGSYSRKRYSNGKYEPSLDEQSADIDRKKLDLLPAELVISFAEGDFLPSETNLNKMFRRFGPLKESETEIALDFHRARVIFKRGADAAAAYSSAGRINIFGTKVVTYQLNYSPPTHFSSSPLLMLEGGHEEAT